MPQYPLDTSHFGRDLLHRACVRKKLHAPMPKIVFEIINTLLCSDSLQWNGILNDTVNPVNLYMQRFSNTKHHSGSSWLYAALCLLRPLKELKLYIFTALGYDIQFIQRHSEQNPQKTIVCNRGTQQAFSLDSPGSWLLLKGF